MKVYNFSAGPATMYKEVIEKAKNEILNYKDSGMSVMELSHRSKLFDEIIEESKRLLIELMEIPEDYEVLFLQGGASLQFTMLPLNLAIKNKRVAFINTGIWTKKAIKEAKKLVEADIVASSEKTNFSNIPKSFDINKNYDYLHLCWNNTIYGTKFNTLPKVDIPIVVDMSSSILSERINVRDYGVIFAGAQKNLGPAGVTIVVVKKELLERVPKNLPSMLDYKLQSDKKSMFNTPPTYSIYMVKLVLEHLKSLGGIEKIEKINKKKAKLLYDYIDRSCIYKGIAVKEDRSLMNVSFFSISREVEDEFIKEAKKNGIENIKGHRDIGGMRASIYNAMPIEGVEALIKFMKKFEEELLSKKGGIKCIKLNA